MERECMKKLNEYCQRQKLTLVYADVKVTGLSHDPEFTVVVKIDGVEYRTGTGKNKKEARAVAAKETWEMIEKQLESPSNMQAEELVTSPVTLPPVPDNDYVSRLNMFSQRTRRLVDYSKKQCSGGAHAPMFSCSCVISGTVYGIGTGPSLAAAKQAAAKQAYEKLDKEGSLTHIPWIPLRRKTILILIGSEKSNSNFTLGEHSNSSRAPIQSDSDSICFEDSAEKLVEKMKDMRVCEKPSPSWRDTLKGKRQLAANFGNIRNEGEKKKMSDSDESLPHLDTDTRESPYTVNQRFLESFRNIEPIGEGAFGNVFKGIAKNADRTYAVKRVCFTKKVNREVKELARLDHENIVRYYFSWEGDDYVTYPDSRKKSEKKLHCLFITMEFCEQGTLENWIEKKRQTRKYHEMAQNKFLQVLKGVEYIHSKDLIHRDLKPQNIFISHEDKIKIGDFGLVTSLAYGTLSKNRGTESYMAPEQFGDKYGKEVDIYALGLIWFEVLSPCSRHEKSEIWHDIREGKLPERLINQFPAEVWDFNTLFQLIYSLKNNLLTFTFFLQATMIKRMLSRDSSGRLSASEILHLMSVDKNNSLKTPFTSFSDSAYKSSI
ncbi:interferon-induced, double-stranded RNA-activated protein kinase isoform X2 [Cuculus canorus]|uniref:interferon-induced, double-stranded RNA-activated protein kinase isoform X2 n=1 Tax=Cuculus canorus TaxID=55661 RepID=UPI0023AA6055|nr:interferon-induced, double-stranded RNA-activated protein kinase isoform X2 [Cuculus canorus]